MTIPLVKSSGTVRVSTSAVVCLPYSTHQMSFQASNHKKQLPAVMARWFHCVLNVTSQFTQEYLDGLPSYEVRMDLNDPPTKEKFENTLSYMYVVQLKAGDTLRIAPEMLVFGEPVIHQVLLCRFGERAVCLTIGEMNWCSQYIREVI